MDITAFCTSERMITKKGSSTNKKFENIVNDGNPYEMMVFDKEFPPVAVVKKNIPEFNFTANYFHRYIIHYTKL